MRRQEPALVRRNPRLVRRQEPALVRRSVERQRGRRWMNRLQINRLYSERPEADRREVKRQVVERQVVGSSIRNSLEATTVNMCCPQRPGQASWHVDNTTESF